MSQDKEHEVMFGELTPDGLENVRRIKQSSIQKCPFAIFVVDHYRDDGTCKCDNLAERERMVREWGYRPEDFKDIPLGET